MTFEQERELQQKIWKAAHARRFRPREWEKMQEEADQADKALTDAGILERWL